MNVDANAIRPEADFLSHLQAGRFMLLQSHSTGQSVFFPRVAAPGTGARDLHWVEASGGGIVHACATMRPRPPQSPYNVSLIELDEGPRMMSRVEGVDPSAVTIGMRVRARIAVEDGKPLVVFDPAELG